MLKRAYLFALLIGVGMVLLAVATSADGRSDPSQRLHVQNAVSTLMVRSAGCLTCHTSTDAAPDEPLHTIAYQITSRSYTPIVAAGTRPTARAELDAQLLALGTRLLDLPASDSAAYDNTVGEFLRVYEQSQAGTASVDVLLDQALTLEQKVMVLEHQASPLRFDSPSGAPVVEQMDAAQGSPASSLLAAAAPAFTIFLPLFRAETRLEDRPLYVPSRVVIVSHRAGPPSVDHNDSV